MGKSKDFEEPFEETQALYTQAINAAGLSNLVNVTVLVNNRAKEIFKVNKANKLLKYRAGDDVIIVLNEKIFEQLTLEQRIIVVDDSIAGITYDQEADKFDIKKPDINAFSGVLKKHTFPVWDVIRESIKTLYQVEADEAQAIKDATEKSKKPKNNF